MSKIIRLNNWFARAFPTHWRMVCIVTGLLIAIY